MVVGRESRIGMDDAEYIDVERIGKSISDMTEPTESPIWIDDSNQNVWYWPEPCRGLCDAGGVRANDYDAYRDVQS